MCKKLVLGRFFLCVPNFERVLHGKICGGFRCELLSKYGFIGVAAFANI